MSSARRTNIRWLALLLGVFVVSRISYARAGVRFDTAAVDRGYQLLPSDLLHGQLLRSLWYLHAQPPLLNGFTGLALRSPLSLDATLRLTFLSIGAALTVVLYLLAVDLGAPRPLAFTGTAIFMASPSIVLYENWYFSTYPSALFLAASGLFFVRGVRTHRSLDAALFSASIVALALTRASYHLLWVFAAALVFLFSIDRANRRRAAVAALAALIVLGGVQLKNAVLFRQYSLSSWAGMNLAHMVLRNNDALVHGDVAAGFLSSQALVAPFSSIDRYDVEPPNTGVDALDRPQKAALVPNLNNRAYLAISDRYLRDDLRFIRRHPREYLGYVADSFRTMFTSPADYSWVAENHQRIQSAVTFEHRLLGQRQETYPIGEFDPAKFAPQSRNIEWAAVLAYAAVLLVGIGVVVDALRRRRWRNSPKRSCIAYLAMSVAFGVLVSNLFELGENMRFRVETDPVVMAACLAIVGALWQRRQAVLGRIRPRMSQS